MSRTPNQAKKPIVSRVSEFLEELPAGGVGARPAWRAWQRAGQFVWLVGQGFVANRCPVRAAALAYTTLLALVPLLVVVFALSKSFLKDTTSDLVPRLLDQTVALIAPQLEYLPTTTAPLPAEGQVVVSAKARQQAVEKIQTFIGNIEAGALGTIGTLALLFVAIRLLMTIEAAFNDIWGVEQGRTIWRKIVYYWTVLTLGPLLVIGAVAVTGRIEFASVTGKLLVAPWLERFFLKLLPFVLLWVGFTLLYALMPNTQVHFRAALVGGIVGGTLWQVNNLLNTMYVSRVVTYSKIYGSLGIIPVFLAGLYLSWLIILFGAQVTFAAQNVRNYFQQRAGARFDEFARERLASRIVLAACRHFLRGQPPPSAEVLATELGAPLQLLNRLIYRLTEGGVLAVTAGDPPGVIPARSPDTITVADVLYVVRTRDGRCGEAPPTDGTEPVDRLLGELFATERAAPANRRFSDLALNG